MKDRILIISNNVLSRTKNNGKTLYSFFDSLPKDEINQLYFSSETPEIEGYRYFRINDVNVIKGYYKKTVGGEIFVRKEERKDSCSTSRKLPRNTFTCSVRDLIWHKHWWTKSLDIWLERINPNIVFFVAGDTFFSYEICDYIVNKFNCRLYIYITDDYILPRKSDFLFGRIRRNHNLLLLRNAIQKVDKLFVVSPMMKQCYDKLFNINSYVIVNMADELFLKNQKKILNDKNTINFVYAGSLYYGRDKTIKMLIDALTRYNMENKTHACLSIYTNNIPTKKNLKNIEVEGVSKYKGSLNQEELKIILNQADILVFIESFSQKNIEKTRLSLSTKVPEYMSLKKAILAIGPANISSIDYLKDISCCVTNPENIDSQLNILLSSEVKRIEFVNKAYDKYLSNHNKYAIQDKFLSLLKNE